MPHVINGIGTWHWGKRNIHKETGSCEFCGRVGELRSYDTTLFFVVVFVPIIPLKQERVLRSCPSCRKFRVVKLKDWNETKQREILATVEALRTDSRSPENISRAIRTVVSYQDETAFLRLAAVIGEGKVQDAQLNALLGAAYDYFLRYPQGEACYRESLRLKDEPVVREDLARCLMKQMRPDEALPMVEHVFKDSEEKKVGLLALLVEGFQNVGKHSEALALLARIKEVFPHLATQKHFAKYEKVSRKNLATGKVIRSANLATPRRRAGDGAAWRFAVPQYIGLGVALIAVGGYLASCISGGYAREVRLVNGLDKSYEVVVAGQPYKLDPHGERVIQVAEGLLPVHVATPGITVPDHSYSIATSFFARPFLNRAFVINPDGCALLVKEEISYYPQSSASAHTNDNIPYQIHTGEDFYTFDGVDYPFRDSPHNITMSENESRRVKSHLFVLKKIPKAQIAPFLEKKLGPAKAADYFKLPFCRSGGPGRAGHLCLCGRA
jgi:tetratricopeptide (TPR) repeat protein